MRAFHAERGASVTIALHHVEDARAFGLVATDGDGRVSEFREKPEDTVPGDINAGTGTFWQTVARPVPQWNPYRTALKGVYLCSASTPPGGGVHGMCGVNAARIALADLGRWVESDDGRGSP